MDLIPLSHNVSSLSNQDSILDTYLMQHDLLERLHDTIHLSSITHKSEKYIGPETLASMLNISLENAKRTIDNTT